MVATDRIAVFEKLDEKYFRSAELLLNVIPANQIEDACPHAKLSRDHRPIYNTLQENLYTMLDQNLKKIPSATRVIPAPLAVRGSDGSVDFEKYSVPGPLLNLVDKQRKLAQHKRGHPLKIVTNCTVTLIEQQNGAATALETSRGVVSVGNAKLILAMGAVPPATLVLNSFPEVSVRI